MSTPRSEPGSFRDRDSRVFYRDDEVLRALSARALADWRALEASAVFRRAAAAGEIVETCEVELPPELAADAGAAWEGALRHARIPLISYPYEWSFGMLRAAALLQLRLLREALGEGLMLKDASPYNVQWKGVDPVFVDVPSFQRRPPGDPWPGYLQFCQLFLYPLLLEAHKGVAFQPWLRGSLDGITPEQCDAMFTVRDRLRRGVLTHVHLQARLTRAWSREASSVRRELRRTGFDAAVIVHNVRRLEALVESLSSRSSGRGWVDYAATHGYAEEDHAAKHAFVAECCGSRRWRRVWDLGANTGEYSRIAAEHSELVVALDSDPAAIDRLFADLRREGTGSRILPLVFDLTDPSPGLGWRGRERRPLWDRGRPDLILALALIHHVVIAGNVPLAELVEWLAGLAEHLVLEFVARHDPRVERLLLNRDDDCDDYDQGHLERALGDHFEILARRPLPSGSRTLYFLRSRGGA